MRSTTAFATSTRRVARNLALLLATASGAAAQSGGAPPAPAPPAQPPPAAAAEPAPSFKLSGLLFGDYYYLARSHRDALEGQNGFWLRRVYLTYDQALAPALALRVRLELNSKGDFKSTGVLAPYLKDAWLKWSFGAHSLAAGLAPTPNIDFVDGFQGYRQLEKSPLDLYRWDSSRDLGLVAQGRLGASRRTQYTFQFGNGSGTGSETDAGKSVRAELVQRFAGGLVLEAYADWQDRPARADWSTLEAVVGYQAHSWRASLQYARQRRRRAGPEGRDLGLDLVSAFATARLAPRLGLVARVDRAFDPVPGGEALDYLPFAEGVPALLSYVAAELSVAKTVRVIPNVELVRYGRAGDGSRPHSDLVPRLTLFASW